MNLKHLSPSARARIMTREALLDSKWKPRILSREEVKVSDSEIPVVVVIPFFKDPYRGSASN